MEHLTGIWEGEYTVNIGSDETPTIEYHSFRLSLIEKDGEFTGTSEDITLSNEPATIAGFRDADFISFIKKYNRLILTENMEYFVDDSAQHPDIHYLGTYNQEESCYEGTWEMQESEEQVSLQNAYKISHFTGSWYMRKVG
ncbi:hypothetical protein QWY31_09050 [Cytophagales bacterium LB-30]|uniref:DUF1579 domain-containing protein n=1 Tax=Shiella aurantiaca TaxID=3058365 RepID=A0ABT8F5S2_9BACT|nr:hypothetical protein [Shiella aurantiaca]MDN4165648.1 hypothetical protein [Shiella aurantiaca]